MDARRKRLLGERLRRLADAGSAVLVATHDTAFAADFADRVVLMGQGVVIADGASGAVLAGGWHFAPEVARCLDGVPRPDAESALRSWPPCWTTARSK